MFASGFTIVPTRQFHIQSFEICDWNAIFSHFIWLWCYIIEIFFLQFNLSSYLVVVPIVGECLGEFAILLFIIARNLGKNRENISRIHPLILIWNDDGANSE